MTLRPQSVIYLVCFAALAAMVLLACGKTKSVITPVPVVDTNKLLTTNRWNLIKFWEDMNNNGRIDSGETVHGLDFVTVYIFATNGVVRDSTAAYLSRTGTWYYKDTYMSAFYCKWNSTNIDLHYIIAISDTELVTKRWGTNETWYFVKY